MRCPGHSVAAAAAEAGLVVRGWAKEDLIPGSKALVRPVLAEAVGRVVEAAAIVEKRSADVRPKQGKADSTVYH